MPALSESMVWLSDSPGSSIRHSLTFCASPRKFSTWKASESRCGTTGSLYSCRTATSACRWVLRAMPASLIIVHGRSWRKAESSLHSGTISPKQHSTRVKRKLRQTQMSVQEIMLSHLLGRRLRHCCRTLRHCLSGSWCCSLLVYSLAWRRRSGRRNSRRMPSSRSMPSTNSLYWWHSLRSGTCDSATMGGSRCHWCSNTRTPSHLCRSASLRCFCASSRLSVRRLLSVWYSTCCRDE
mmetsp:Transcript_42440/g.120427  ORF Transcript_42440/g.120427 Transcript_42440/m.120427 type:complete len:238 (-) Transcript_42440:619-1332(-)